MSALVFGGAWGGAAAKGGRDHEDGHSRDGHSHLIRSMAGKGLVSRVTPVHTAMRNSTRDEGGPFEVDNQVLISSHRKLLWSKAMVVSVAEKPKQDSGRHD